MTTTDGLGASYGIPGLARRINACVRGSRDPEAGRQPRSAQVDAVSEHRNAFLNQELALSPSHRHAPVGADHPMPWEPFVSGGEKVTDQSRRFRVDVAIGADKSNRNRAHAAEDARCSRGEAVARRRHLACDLLRGAFRGSSQQELALPHILRQRRAALELGARLFVPAELPKEVAAHGRQ